MTKLILKIFLIVLANDLIAQSDSNMVRIINSFTSIKDMPYICEVNSNIGCGDSLFWFAIKQGEKIIPYLIDRLDDTTFSKTSVPNFGGNYTIADISLFALEIIVWNIPVLKFAEDPDNPEPRNGFWGYWNYTRRNFANRQKFKTRVNYWYKENKNHFIWIDSPLIAGCDCGILKNPAGGHFEIKK